MLYVRYEFIKHELHGLQSVEYKNDYIDNSVTLQACPLRTKLCIILDSYLTHRVESQYTTVLRGPNVDLFVRLAKMFCNKYAFQ